MNGLDTATASAFTKCFADIQPTRLRWLWPGRIPLGKVTVIAGDPGVGKSLVTIDMAARVSNGTQWPDGTDNAHDADDDGDGILDVDDDHPMDPEHSVRPNVDPDILFLADEPLGLDLVAIQPTY